MPMKICFPAVEDKEWELITGCDPKMSAGHIITAVIGQYCFGLWLQLLKTGKTNIGERAIKTAENAGLKLKITISGQNTTMVEGTLVGKAMRYQTWTIAAYVVAKDLMENPSISNGSALKMLRKIDEPEGFAVPTAGNATPSTGNPRTGWLLLQGCLTAKTSRAQRKIKRR
jgi:hypothetical protein